ncbi:copper/iron-regulated glutamine amidotransferase [Aspergillus welwitschiae]|uniref:Copper/iron-regulated glutamine amidotransferase n=1 Tax=Aspergillus welwitschiae TaxID=1341132 RepID=A0A3F3PJ34_9EURO|nr:copper/iron-regulated glutamine amidotransferase [Aspergillus welwitschiae]RDH26752.1 copper/iron-regulated glutamine amidotransferase [Aspergillus welwitschiae]
MTTKSQLKTAVLVNNPPGNDFWHDVKKSFRDVFSLVAPEAEVTFYDPHFDLIVLSGGKADASSSEPWVLGVLDFIRKIADGTSKTKLLGICWGHQAIARALGGEVRPVPTGPIAAIQDIQLTDFGRDFFAFAAEEGYYRAPEFHVREVAKPAPGFVQLAENRECFLNVAGTILTFQAHPEINSDLARRMLLDEDDTYNGNSTKEQLDEQVRRLAQATDGIELVKRVIQWVRE